MPADTTPPVLRSLSLPSTVDVSGGDATVTATVGATDVGMGVDFVYVTLDRNFQTPNGRGSTFYLYDSRDSFADGVSSTNQVFTHDTAPGTYNIQSVTIYDKAGNYTIYNTNDLASHGFQTSITVTGGRPADTTPPELSSLSLPSTVDVSGGDVTVTATVGATDIGLGVDFVYVTLDHNFQAPYGRGSTFYLYDSRDSFTDGISSTNEVFTHDTAPGTYNIESVTVYDKAGNYTIYDTDYLASHGFQTSITVTDNHRVNGTNDNDTLIGSDHTDFIDGRAGADMMYGLGGDDLYIVDNSGDRVFEIAGQGTDTIASRVSYALAAGQSVETLRFTSAAGTGNLNLTGNEFDQTLTGNAGANRLDGGGGADRMTGYGGDDSYYVDNAGDLVFEAANGGNDTVYASISYALRSGQSVETLRFTTAAGTADMNLTGNSLAQTLYGNAGANILDGGGGGDTMRGFGGDDTYVINSSNDLVFEASGQGSDTVNSRVSYVLAAGQSVETLKFTSVAGTGNLNLTGNSLAQSLFGNNGANILDGGGGGDSMRGYAGDDTYVINNASDLVFEASGQGSDIVNARVSYVLAAGQSIETLKFTSTTGTGNLNLTGNEVAQTITGNNGNNILDGKGGADILRGYGGADTFQFSTALGPNNIDHIVDFSSVDDTIQLSQTVFAALGLGALNVDAFKDIGASGAVVDSTDRILYDHNTGALYYDADGSGTAGRIQFAVLDNKPATLTHADFLVVA